jgi:hypothetical protein
MRSSLKLLVICMIFAPGATVSVAILFLLPARHAGEGGDVSDICDALMADGMFEDIQISKLMSEHPLLALILKDRLAAKYSVALNNLRICI